MIAFFSWFEYSLKFQFFELPSISFQLDHPVINDECLSLPPSITRGLNCMSISSVSGMSAAPCTPWMAFKSKINLKSTVRVDSAQLQTVITFIFPLLLLLLYQSINPLFQVCLRVIPPITCLQTLNLGSR